MRSSRFFVSVRREKPRLAFPFVLCPCRWRRRRVPELARPVQLAPGCNGLLSIMFVYPFNSVSLVRVIVATPSGLPKLSGFSAFISAGWTIVQRFVDNVPLRLRPKVLSSYKVKLVNCITLLSDRALAPSCHSFARIRPAYYHQGTRSSAAEGQWSHLRS